MVGSSLRRLARLEALGEQLDGGNITVRRRRADERPHLGH